MGALADLYVVLSLQNGQFAAGLDESAAAGEEFTAKFTAGMEETAAAARGAAEQASAAADGVAEAQARIGESATAAGDAEKGLADMQRLEAEMATTAADSTKALADAQMASVDAAAASARAQGTLKDAEAAAALGAAEGADAQEAAAAKTDEAAAAAEGAGSHFKMFGLAVAAGVVLSAKAAADWQQLMTRLVTSAGESARNLPMVSTALLQMSVSTNTSSQQLAQAMYWVESAGIHGRDAVQVVKAAAEGAQAEGANVGTVADALTTMMKDFHLAPAQAIAAMNELVTTVANGKMTLQQLSQALATVGPIAAKAGLSYSQVAGDIAEMTAQGVSAQEATFLLRHVLMSLESPTNVQTAAMQQLGLSVTNLEQHIGQRGLTGTLEVLNNAVLAHMGKSGLVITNMFNQSKSAAQDAEAMIGKMPASIRGVAQAYLEGKVTAQEWQKVIYSGSESARSQALLQQFHSEAQAAFGFNSFLKAGSPLAQTYLSWMSKLTGGMSGVTVAQMLMGKSLAATNAITQKVADSAQHAGSNVQNWALIQHNFNFQLGSAEKAAKAVAISFGQALLPAVTTVLHAVTTFGSWVARSTIASRVLAVVVGVLLAGALEHGLAKALKTSTGGFSDAWKAAQKLSGMLHGTATASEAAAGAETLQATAADASAVATDTAAASVGALQVALDALGIGLIIAAIVGLVIGLVELYKHCKAVRDVVADVGRFFGGLWRDAMKVAGDAIRAFENGPLKTIQAGIAQLDSWWRQHSQEIEEVTRVVWAVVSSVIKVALALISVEVRMFLIPLETAWRVAWGLIKDTVVTVWHLISNQIKIVVTLIEGVIGVFLDLVTGHWSQAWHDLLDTGTKLLGEIRNLISTFVTDCLRLLFDAGKNLVLGLVHGFESLFGDVKSAVTSLASDILGWFTGSGVNQGMHTAGATASANLAAGVDSGVSAAFAAGANVGASARAGVAAGLSGQAGSSQALHGITAASAGASLGHSLASAALSGFSSGVGSGGGSGGAGGGGGGGGGSGLGNALGSAAKSASSSSGAKTAADVMRQIGLQLAGGLIKALHGSASQVKSAITTLMTDVKDELNAGLIGDQRATALTRFLEHDNTRLEDLANKRARILKEMATAAKYATTTTQSAESTFGVVNAAGGGTAPATSATILATLRTDLTSIRKFKENIAKLQKMGLNRAYIGQIIAAGPVDGGQIAQELASGSWSQIQQINTVESQVTSASKSLGRTAADAMYDSGRDAGKGFLSGLEHQQKSIEQMMKRIARVMVDTIRRELRISSPSQVMREHGLAVAQGLAVGIDDGIASAAAASKRLAGAVSAGVGASGAGGGGTVIHLEPHITVNGYIGSEQQLVDKLLPPLQQVVLEIDRRNPGTGNGLSLGQAAGRAA